MKFNIIHVIQRVGIEGKKKIADDSLKMKIHGGLLFRRGHKPNRGNDSNNYSRRKSWVGVDVWCHLDLQPWRVPSRWRL